MPNSPGLHARENVTTTRALGNSPELGIVTEAVRRKVALNSIQTQFLDCGIESLSPPSVPEASPVIVTEYKVIEMHADRFFMIALECFCQFSRE